LYQPGLDKHGFEEYLMKKRTRFWLILLVVALATGGGYAAVAKWRAAETAAEEERPLQTTSVRRGNIIISATGAGTVIPAEQLVLSFAGSGTLAELMVQVGDEVRAGDVLARLDDTNAQQAVTNAELQLVQASLQTDPETLERTIALAEIGVEQAEINLEIAQAELDELLNWVPDEATVALAESNLEVAKANHEDALARDAAAGNSLISVNISLQQAERSLADAQEAYATAYDPGREWELYMTDPSCLIGQGGSSPCTGQPLSVQLERERAAAESAITRAEENLAIARANYTLSASNLNDNNGLSAQSSVLSAEIALENALTGPTDSEIEAAGIKVRQAELSLRQSQLNLAAARENDQAEISQAQAQLNLEAAQRGLQETFLVAPTDGTVMAIAAQPGESAGPGFITLADLSQPLLELYLDETDLDQAAVGFEVQILFDALPDDPLTGQVVQIDPQLSTVNGVSAIRMVVQVDAASFAKPQTLPVGLNATVDVIGGRAQNALIVPVEALRELSPGNYSVFVMEDGEPELRIVEVGLMDFTFAEILSGLEEGQIVTTGIVETN
jgi:multidrug efflux pump subunit AcrA (membrane-fusion protein)